jgi:coproporphyrinogen III oxidase
MRVWDLDPKFLCRNHLLGEHREIHAIWNIITLNKKGYGSHPETRRWIGKLKALYLRHEKVKSEMIFRDYHHKSELNKKFALGKSIQDKFINTPQEQIKILKDKGCNCQFC